MMLGSPSKPFLLKLSPIVAAVADFRLLLWENQQIPKLGQLGKSIRLANMPTVLNGGGGVCRFETPITLFFAIETYQPPKTNRKIRPWNSATFSGKLILLSPSPFFRDKKKTAFTSGDELLDGKKFRGNSRSPLGLATPRLDTCASWHRSPPLPRPGVRKLGNLPVAVGGSGESGGKGWNSPKKSVLQSQNGDAFFVGARKRYVLQTNVEMYCMKV